MAEYTEREAAKRCVKEHYDDAIIIAIDAIPAADVAPVRHGRWVPHRLNNGYTTWTCSDCGTVGVAAFHYCPNCGAKMESDE